MKTIWLKITAQAPLALNEHKPGGSQFQEGLKFIPGTVVRGAVARALNYSARPGYEALWQAITQETACFGDAGPGIGARPHLLPTTAASCKDHAGFKTAGQGHGVFDTLIDRLCWETLQPPGLLYLPGCPECDGRLKAQGGWYTVRSGRYYANIPVSHLLTRVAINRRRAVAEARLLYSVNVMSEYMEDPLALADLPARRRLAPTEFRSPVRLPDAAAAQLLALLPELEVLGGGSSRGLGQVEVAEDETPGAELPLANRLADFNATIAGRKSGWEALARGQKLPAGGYFTLDLQAEAILERDWQPAYVYDAAALQSESGCQAPLTLVRSYAGYSYRSGWQGAWGLPKETAATTRAGSLFLFHTKDLKSWAEALARLEEDGIGARRGEGFGRVRVCDEFHTVMREEAK